MRSVYCSSCVSNNNALMLALGVVLASLVVFNNCQIPGEPLEPEETDEEDLQPSPAIKSRVGGGGGSSSISKPTSFVDDNSDPTSRSTFKPTDRNVTVNPGDRAVLKCKVENLGTKTVTWRKRDEIHPLTIGMFAFAPDSRIAVDYNQRTMEWLLMIQDVRPTDEGYYCCQISTKHDRDTYDIKLNVRTIQVSGTEYMDAGSEIKLTCNATGRPEPPHNVDWYKDGVRITSDAQKGAIITKKIETRVLVSQLFIKNGKPSDSGKYVCQSTNGEEGSISVHIFDGPSTAVEKRADKERVGSFRLSGGHSTSPPTSTPSRILLPVTVLLTALLAVQLRTSVTSRPRSCVGDAVTMTTR